MKNQRNRNFVRNSLFYVIVVLGIMGLIYCSGPTQTSNTKTISTSTFMTELRDKRLIKSRFNLTMGSTPLRVIIQKRNQVKSLATMTPLPRC